MQSWGAKRGGGIKKRGVKTLAVRSSESLS